MKEKKMSKGIEKLDYESSLSKCEMQLNGVALRMTRNLGVVMEEINEEF